MENSPYKSPQFESLPRMDIGGGASREKLRRVARYQRWVMLAVLAAIGGSIMMTALELVDRRAASAMVATVAVVVIYFTGVLFMIVSVVMLTNQIGGTGLAVLCALLMFVPCVSLIALLVVNQKATNYLQQHGVRVGFFGVDPNRI